METPNPAQILEILTLARKKIKNPLHWGQNHYAVDTNGETCLVADATATKWCAVGALMAVGQHLNLSPFPAESRLIQCAANITGSHSAITFNDSKSHGEVMEMFECAIDKARKAIVK